MKLLFKKNEDDDACDRLKELIPYIDADLNFNSLKPDLITSTNDVYGLIGKDIYNQAVLVFESEEELNDLQEEFLRVVSYPIAVNGYRLYAPTNDLSHTDNGRRMRSNDTEKTPFEWMLDRDNAAQEKRYYRALDDLVLFLDRLVTYTTPASPEETLSNVLTALWKNSDAFKASNKLFIRTVIEFDDCFPIQSRILLIKLEPGIKKCEQFEIIPRITKEKYDELKTKLETAVAITDAKDLQLLKLIRETCASYALAWSMMRYSVNLYPEGVLQHYTSDRATTQSKKPSINAEPEAARMAFTADFETYAKAIEQLLEPEPETSAEFVQIQPLGNCNDGYMST